MATVDLLFKRSLVICQKALFLKFMVMHLRKQENEGTSFRE